MNKLTVATRSTSRYDVSEDSKWKYFKFSDYIIKWNVRMQNPFNKTIYEGPKVLFFRKKWTDINPAKDYDITNTHPVNKEQSPVWPN